MASTQLICIYQGAPSISKASLSPALPIHLSPQQAGTAIELQFQSWYIGAGIDPIINPFVKIQFAIPTLQFYYFQITVNRKLLIEQTGQFTLGQAVTYRNRIVTDKGRNFISSMFRQSCPRPVVYPVQQNKGMPEWAQPSMA